MDNTTDSENTIICGYVWTKDEKLDCVGHVTPQDMWWSFPCIRIPNKIARECGSWFYYGARNEKKYTRWLRAKKFDDWFFREYLKLYYPDYDIINLKPNLVDHIDYLIGGSVTNNERNDNIVQAQWFDDLDLIDELRVKLQQE